MKQKFRDLPWWQQTLIICGFIGGVAGIFAIIDFFLDWTVTKTIQKKFFAPRINIEQNISPEALNELRKSSPDGTIRIEKGITIREGTDAEDQR